MRRFNTKTESFDYIKNKFISKDVVGIAVVGSTAKGRIKKFSDIDVVVFNKKRLKPYYELFLIEDQKIDAPPRLKSRGLKRCSIFGCSKC
ncbi:nucleotidyltransferase domain-containing protein [Candidatus Pacearchaeota archaeon]|nr:nucleotidyltransferase domain-containing protein [Candidatus Pacearchaeota archaeon]